MSKEDLMNVSATNEGPENAGSGSAENTQLRFGNGNGDGIGAKVGQAAGSAAKDVAVRTGNRLKKGMKEFGKAASAFLAPLKKYVVIGAIIAIAVVLILVLITAAFKYLLEQGTIDATNDALNEFKDAKLLNLDYLYGYRGQTSDIDEVIDTIEFYMRQHDQVFTRVASTSRAPVEEQLTEMVETADSSAETVTVDSVLAGMTLEEKIYQLMMVQAEVSDGNSLSNVKYGGYIVATGSNYSNNLGSIGSNYKIAPFIATDDEGGTVRRAASQYTTNARTYGDNKDYDTLYSDELEKSNYLLGLGINLNLGPVTDVISSGALYERSFSGEHDVVKQCVTKIMEARKNSNKNGISISSSLKHYPGYPDTDINSDHGIAESSRSMEDINKNIEVFKSGINSGAQSVMVSNVIYLNYDSQNPASLSSKIIGDLRANFDGVIMTDDIGNATGVKNISDRYKKAIIAGNDMILIWNKDENGNDLISEAYNQINDAVSSGELTEEQINEKVKRILNWKAEVGLLNASGSSSSNNTQNNNSTTQSGGRTTEAITIKQNAAGEYCVAVDVDEKIDNIYNDLKEDNNALISKFKNEAQAKESLKLWAIAEFSSQYLNLSSDVENYQHDYDADYIQGMVKVKRYTQNDDGTETEKYLTYKPQEEFDTLMANYESSEDTTVFNHFTINAQDDLVIAKYVKTTQDSSWSGTEDPKGQLDEIYTRYEVSEQKLPYRNAIVQYTMPYYLFVALTMYGDDAEFTNEVARLIADSEMVIGIRDNVTTSVTTTYDRYLREEERTESANMTASAAVGNQYDEAKGTYIKYSISPSNSIKGFVEAADAQDFEANTENTKLIGIEVEPYYEKKTVKTVITNSVAMNIEYIDGWCFNHKIEYEAKEQDSSTGNNVSNIENTAYETTQAYTKIKENLTDEDEIYNLMTSSEVVRNVHTKATDGLNRDQILLHGVDTRIANYLYTSGSPIQGDAYKVLQNLHNSSEKGLAKSIIYATGWNFSSLSEEYLSSLGITTDAETVKTEAGNLYSTIYNGIRNSDNWDIKIINSYISLNLIEYGRNIRERIVNRTVTTCTDTNTKQYNKISTETVEKTEKNPEPGEENFVSILCDSKYKRVKHSLTGSTSAWFFETLEKSSQTECLIDLLKYLFYKATNNDYGVTEYEFDFTLKSVNNMNSISGMYGKDILTRFTEAWEGTEKDADGNYVIHRASSDPTIGYGINLYYNLEHFQKAGFFTDVTLEEWQGSLYNQRKTQQGQRLCNSDGTVITNEDIDKVKKYVIEECLNDVEAYLTNNGITGLEDYQKHALVQVRYQKGNINNLTSYYPDNMESFFLSYWQDGQYSRRQTVLELWNTGIYKDKNGNEIIVGGNGEFVPTEDAGANSGIAGYFTSGGRTYTIYLQTRGPWAGEDYYFNRTTTISAAACGMVSTLNVATGWGCTYEPVAFRDAYTGGGWSGVAAPMASCLKNNFAVNSSIAWQSGYNKEDMAQHLQQGYPIIVLVHNYYLGSHFYGGHYFTILGISEDGTQVFVGDSGGMNRTGWYNIDDVIKPGLDNYLKVY